MRTSILRGLPIILVLVLASCAGPGPGVGSLAPPLLSPHVERNAQIIRQGLLDCGPDHRAHNRTYKVSDNGRFFALHTKCYRGRTHLGDFIDVYDLERNRRVVHLPHPAGLTASRGPLVLRFADGDQRLQLAVATSAGREGNYATRLELLEVSTETGETLADYVLLLDVGLPSAALDWTNRGLFVGVYNLPSAPRAVERFYAVEWRSGSAPTIRETLESTQLASLAHPDALAGMNITVLPHLGGAYTALVESQGVLPEPDGITHAPREQGWGRHDGYGRFVLDLMVRAEADVVDHWPGYAVDSGVAVESLSPDGRLLAVRRGGFVSGEANPEHCGAHVRRTDGFELVGRLPCAPENRGGNLVEYRTLEIFFSGDSRTFAAVRGNGGYLDLVSIAPWRQTHRLAARELGVRSIALALAHPQPNTYLVADGRGWSLVRVN